MAPSRRGDGRLRNARLALTRGRVLQRGGCGLPRRVGPFPRGVLLRVHPRSSATYRAGSSRRPCTVVVRHHRFGQLRGQIDSVSHLAARTTVARRRRGERSTTAPGRAQHAPSSAARRQGDHGVERADGVVAGRGRGRVRQRRVGCCRARRRELPRHHHETRRWSLVAHLAS